jgi:hypothetical protein
MVTRILPQAIAAWQSQPMMTHIHLGLMLGTQGTVSIQLCVLGGSAHWTQGRLCLGKVHVIHHSLLLWPRATEMLSLSFIFFWIQAMMAGWGYENAGGNPPWGLVMMPASLEAPADPWHRCSTGLVGHGLAQPALHSTTAHEWQEAKLRQAGILQANSHPAQKEFCQEGWCDMVIFYRFSSA